LLLWDLANGTNNRAGKIFLPNTLIQKQLRGRYLTKFL